MRMQMRRFTRLSDAFSKKWEYLDVAISLQFFDYNFMRIHQTLRVTPAKRSSTKRVTVFSICRIAPHSWILTSGVLKTMTFSTYSYLLILSDFAFLRCSQIGNIESQIGKELFGCV